MAPNNNQKRNPASMMVAILMLLLMVIALIIVLRSCAAGSPEPSPSQPAAESTIPVPAQTETPSPEPSPTPTPTAEPSPSSTPTPEPAFDESGSFRSDTGTGLNIVADWTAVSAGGGKATLTVTLYAESYSIQCAAIRNGGTIVIDGESHTFSTNALDYAGSTSAKNLLGTVTVTLPLGDDGKLSVPVSAKWGFQGTYSGKEINSISAEGTVAAG